LSPNAAPIQKFHIETDITRTHFKGATEFYNGGTTKAEKEKLISKSIEQDLTVTEKYQRLAS
jgi:hypothetical protein